jgi:hypothetical protein
MLIIINNLDLEESSNPFIELYELMLFDGIPPTAPCKVYSMESKPGITKDWN